jgi:hypothetical protein
MNHKLNIIVLVALVVKLILLFFTNNDLKMNPDEEHNYQIAFNHQHGLGYTIYVPEINTYKQTSFHSSFPVFIYEFLLKNDIKKDMWILFIHGLSLLLFLLSVIYFYKLSILFTGSENAALLSVITYCSYPSVLYYIGSLFLYENIVLPVLVIIVYRVIHGIKTGYKTADYLTIPIAIGVCCLLRPQLIMIYVLLLTVSSVYILITRKYKLLLLTLITISAAILLHVPILEKTKKQFGKSVLSTQTGFELLQGHHPEARGSWMGDWQDSTNQLFKYAHSNIEHLGLLNELEEGDARKQLAIKWIKEHPVQELILQFRKLGIYFLPKNFEVLPGYNFLNPINLLIHLLFISFLLKRIYSKRISFNELLLLMPVLGSIILSLIFFVGYRWRYYAEPFMIIFAWQLLSEIRIYTTKKLNNK